MIGNVVVPSSTPNVIDLQHEQEFLNLLFENKYSILKKVENS